MNAFLLIEGHKKKSAPESGTLSNILLKYLLVALSKLVV